MFYGPVLWQCIWGLQNVTCSDWNSQKNSRSRLPKQTAFLSIITLREEHGFIGRYLKTDTTSI
jgi:hypothetical protein